MLESEAVLGIISYNDTRQIEILSSEALQYEGGQSPWAIRKEHTKAVLSKSSAFIKVTNESRNRAEEIIHFGIKPLDALHIAFADSGKADYFCTCDDRLLKNAKEIADLKVVIFDPVALIQEIAK
jgi:predicted nucleic acid-binding protein